MSSSIARKPNTRGSKSASQAVTKAYKEHAAGSRKGKVHELYDKQGAEAAWTLGAKLGFKEGTLRSWFGVWKRDGAAAAAAKNDTRKKAGSTPRGDKSVSGEPDTEQAA